MLLMSEFMALRNEVMQNKHLSSKTNNYMTRKEHLALIIKYKTFGINILI